MVLLQECWSTIMINYSVESIEARMKNEYKINPENAYDSNREFIDEIFSNSDMTLTTYHYLININYQIAEGRLI